MVFSDRAFKAHEQVTYFNDPSVGLQAIVAIHNTALGPALGGCRMRLYQNEAQALEDVLRLSEGMTYKSAIAGLDLGGGKAVLIADPRMKEGRRELFLAFAECLNRLGGRYITAEDMGTSVSDIMTMRERTQFAAGFAGDKGGSGDPSPWTALGVFHGIRAGVKHAFGSEDLRGKRVAVQGIGHVGYALVGHLTRAGAHVIVCDTSMEFTDRASREFGVTSVGIGEIYDVACDVFAPCAVGQTINASTLSRIQARVIAGAANNQLSDSSVYSLIENRRVIYVPDFVINAGGICSVFSEYGGSGDSALRASWVTKKCEGIFDTVLRVLEEAKHRKQFPEVVALELARERVDAATRRS